MVQYPPSRFTAHHRSSLYFQNNNISLVTSHPASRQTFTFTIHTRVYVREYKLFISLCRLEVVRSTVHTHVFFSSVDYFCSEKAGTLSFPSTSQQISPHMLVHISAHTDCELVMKCEICWLDHITVVGLSGLVVENLTLYFSLSVF